MLFDLDDTLTDPAMGILCGYGSAEDLTKAGARSLVSTPQEMAEVILLCNSS